MSFDWVTLGATFGAAIIGAIVGGFIAGHFAIKATNKSFEHQRTHADENESKLITGVLQAIHDEMETIYERYQETMGAKLESLQDGAALLCYYPLISDYFTIYNGNSSLIGRIPDNDLRKQIIKTYTMTKGMADSFRMNNDLVGKFEYSNKIFEETQQDVHKQHADAHHSS
ncbi:MAG: hypothetical protein GXP21_08740, partial [Gammaproteobacteria bacterium]|nr:hypothetical protein [Gammaproteobacteria bacterium]